MVGFIFFPLSAHITISRDKVDSALKYLKQVCMLFIKEKPGGNNSPGARIAGQNPVICTLNEFRREGHNGTFWP